MKNEDNYSGLQELLAIENSLEAYNLDLVTKFRKSWQYSENISSESVVDFGAGTGTLAEIWRNEFNVFPICIEIDSKCTEILKKKNFRTFHELNEIEDESISYIYSSNVLEHIDEDEAVLAELFLKLKSGGLLTIYVPAIPFLYSEFDQKVGHFRRYRKKELISKIENAGFKVKHCEWNDSFGILAALLLKLIGYRSRGLLSSGASLVFYDHYVYPISKFFDFLFFRKIAGKNLLIHALK